jgi:hypothetical protein
MNDSAIKNHLAISDAELAAMSRPALLDLRSKVTAELTDIEGQLSARGDAAKSLPYDPDKVPPERAWYVAAKRARAHRAAFLSRLKPFIAAAHRAAAIAPRPTRSQGQILYDLARLLAPYEFPDDEELRAAIAEATAFAERVAMWRKLNEMPLPG